MNNNNNDDEKKKTNEFERYLPIANIGRIIKKNLPNEVKLSRDAKETFQECVSEFISFITSEASDRCNSEKRKTINGEDILYAMNNLGFEKYTPILKIYLDKFRESQKIVDGKENENNEENIFIKENNNNKE
jgi:histone H3/H4